MARSVLFCARCPAVSDGHEPNRLAAAACPLPTLSLTEVAFYVLARTARDGMPGYGRGRLYSACLCRRLWFVDHTPSRIYCVTVSYGVRVVCDGEEGGLAQAKDGKRYSEQRSYFSRPIRVRSARHLARHKEDKA
jgi:hypothetical protein